MSGKHDEQVKLLRKFMAESSRRELWKVIGEDKEKEIADRIQEMVKSKKSFNICRFIKKVDKEFSINLDRDHPNYINYQILLFQQEVFRGEEESTSSSEDDDDDDDDDEEEEREEEGDKNGRAEDNSRGNRDYEPKVYKVRYDMNLWYGGPLLADLKITVIPETTLKLFREMKEKAKQKYDFTQYLRIECVFAKHDSEADNIFENIKSEVRTTRFNLLEDQVLRDAINEHIWGLTAEHEFHLYYKYQLFVAEKCKLIRSFKDISKFYEVDDNRHEAKIFFDHFPHSKLLEEIEHVHRSISFEESYLKYAAEVELERSLLQHHRFWEGRQSSTNDAVYNFLFRTRSDVDKLSDEEELKEILNTRYPFCHELWSSLLNALIVEMPKGAQGYCS